MEIFLKAAGLCITAALTGVLIKRDAAALALLLAAAALAGTLLTVAGMIGETVGFIKEIAEKAEMEPQIISSLLKVAGLCILTRFGADICEDAGMKAAASGVNIAGGTAAIATSMPLLKAVYQLISGLM